MILHQEEMDELTYKSSSMMMNSAFFGQLIILIVFTPILFLTGVEGKMFKPMAFTFGYAVLGALILRIDLCSGDGIYLFKTNIKHIKETG